MDYSCIDFGNGFYHFNIVFPGGLRMKRKLIICGILAIFCMLISVGNAENHVDGKALLEEIP
jgi:hypothetical protein